MSMALIKKQFAAEFAKLKTPSDSMALGRKIKTWAASNKVAISEPMRQQLADYMNAQCEKCKNEGMSFPMLQMLAEGKKKAVPMDDMDAELDMDMEIDTSMEPVKKSKSMGDKKAAPKGMKDTPSAGDAPVVDKAAVLKFLKGCDAACRADVHKKLMKMVAADEAAAE